MGPVLEKHDEAKRKEDKEGQPKEAAKQRHRQIVEQQKCQVNALVVAKVRIEPRNETAKLFAPCACRFSI